MGLEKLNELTAEIENTDDRMLRSEILIDLAKEYAEAPESVAKRPFSEEHKSPACQSDAFVWVVRSGDSLTPFFTVENPQGLSAKALAAVLVKTCSGISIAEMREIEDGIVHRIFGPTLSMGKGEGLMGMIRKMKQLAEKAVKTEGLEK